MKRLTQLAALFLCLTASGLAQDNKKVMHCFVFTPVAAATEADWSAFFKATDALPGKVPGLSKVWYGKLARPFAVFQLDADANKLLREGAPSAKAEAKRLVRSWGVCMEFADQAALTAYGPHPAHKEWDAVYSKVREYGTNTLDIVGQ